MADPSEASPVSPDTRRTCPDCGKEFVISTGRGLTANCCEECQVKRMTFVPTSVPHLDTPTPAPEKKAWHRSRALWFSLLIVSAVVTGGLVWRKELRRQYHRWSQNLHARRAAENFEKKDYEHAILDGRAALDLDSLDVEANRIIAKSLEAQGSGTAIAWRARLNVVHPGDVENAIAWAHDALKAGAFDNAEDALAVLKPADRDSAECHDIVAQIAMARTDPVAAESHWREAVRLEPRSEDYRLKLAAVQVASRSPGVRASAMRTLESLGEIPVHRLTALRALIEDAMNHREFSRARKLADRLMATPGIGFADRLGRLSVLRSQDAPDAPQYLEQLRDESLADAEQLSALLRWMNENGLPLLVADWVAALPQALVTQPPVCLVVADTYGRNRDWPKLRAFVENAAWKDFEHARLAHLAHALENFGNVVAAEQTWSRALAECREMPGRLGMLVRLAQAWRWDARAELTLRKLSADERTPLWMLDALWSIASKSGDSAELHRLSRLIVKARPKNVVARNNFLRLSLLRHLDEGATDKLAAELFQQNPTDLACATTYGLSLFFQSKVFDAVEIMQTFSAAQLRDPAVALYYGIFLQASGDFARADEFLALARGAKLLREEEELITRVKSDSSFNTLTPTRKPPPQKKTE